ncbi:DUF1295-domain-containing protein [Rhizoclosmatium globosum]|uniref:DUF1295-domain-containing protein n=1 Tax=Rhizoclosmatium globosum TaxID=329046 RepID=A0A1Y2CP56_9FUNG|nr:hypothetical protein HDU79_005040 [Rhizoclosmatium sp. JEL0117]ORY48105.1 DUF1295-domain-containing protein [Rhizoclosmatium globosum]|eukprot:ORY48105.1 DUF1295-domain-containing protein [Rhizoclosmatium globosum]
MSDNTSVAGRSLGYTLAVDFGIQFVFYVYSAYYKTEKLYDGSGSLTYLACIFVALLVRPDASVGNGISSIAPRQALAATGVLIWCVRLGSFLFLRVQKHADHRFDELKLNPIRFAVPWFIQVVWIFLTAFPVYIVLANVASLQAALGWSDIIGIIVWILGFTFEAVADAQKNKFKTANPSKFMQTGLFKYSQYPNYFGEVTLWIGMWILCAGGFTDNWQFVSIISPIFVFCLIYFVSGVRLLEASSQKRYGQDPEFIAYKARTSKFIPWFPKKA